MTRGSEPAMGAGKDKVGRHRPQQRQSQLIALVSLTDACLKKKKVFLKNIDL